jgi:hypothetical protein
VKIAQAHERTGASDQGIGEAPASVEAARGRNRSRRIGCCPDHAGWSTAPNVTPTARTT